MRVANRPSTALSQEADVGGEVEHEPGMVLDPFHDIGMLVGGVDNDMDHLFLRHPGVDDV